MKRVHCFRINVSDVAIIYDEDTKTFKMQITNFPNDYVVEMLKFLLFELYPEYEPSPMKSDLIFDKEEEQCIKNLQKKY